MRVIKIITIFCLLIFLLLLGIFTYLYFNSTVSIKSITTETTLANKVTLQFNELTKQIKDNTYTGTIFSETPIEDINEYKFIEYNITLKNQLRLPLDAISVNIMPIKGDVIQEYSDKPIHINANTTQTIQITLLTKVTNTDQRNMEITYYVWGKEFKLNKY